MKSWLEMEFTINHSSGESRILVKPNPDLDDLTSLIVAQQCWDSDKQRWSGESKLYISKDDVTMLVDVLNRMLAFAAEQASLTATQATEG